MTSKEARAHFERLYPESGITSGWFCPHVPDSIQAEAAHEWVKKYAGEKLVVMVEVGKQRCTKFPNQYRSEETPAVE